MRKIIFILAIIFTFAFMVSAQFPATTILKPTLSVRAERDLGYWKLPDAKNCWSWMPKVAFTVTEFTTPDGKPWYSWDTEPISVPAGGLYNVESEAVSSWRDKRSSIATGVFGFKVTLKNNLNGTSKEMYRGTYKVNKTFAGTPHPDFKNQYSFYVDQDWSLPIGYVALNSRLGGESPLLNAGMWFRGDFDDTRMAAYLFYNGKQISSTKSSDKGDAVRGNALIAEGDDKREFFWAYWDFVFFNIRQNAGSGTPNAFVLKDNPGNYEIKVLLDGDIVRTAAFSVGANGEIVDNGIASKNGFAGSGTVIPLKVAGTKEGTLNLQSWKTDAFYGNPLQGFTIQ
jgi:hypothetical protein